VLPATEAVPEDIEVTCVASGVVDHVDVHPPKVDWADPERGNRCDVDDPLVGIGQPGTEITAITARRTIV
jgi:hypothetical protein